MKFSNVQGRLRPTLLSLRILLYSKENRLGSSSGERLGGIRLACLGGVESQIEVNVGRGIDLQRQREMRKEVAGLDDRTWRFD